MIYVFQGCSLDSDRRELHRNGNLVAIEPQAFDLLEFLVRNRARVVSKEDLIAEVWRGRIVSDSALTSRITAVRHAIGDSGRAQRLIRTAPRKGLRFVATVEEVHQPKPGAPTGTLSQTQRPPGPSELASAPALSIVVLPFTNLGDDREQEYFADGIVDDLTTDLTRIEGAFVIARNTAMTYRNRVVDARQVRRELSVGYALEGSVRRLGNRVRINAQLIETETGGHVWAETFDGDVGNLWGLSEEVTLGVGRALSVNLVNAASRRVARKESPDAVDLALRGRAAINRRITRENYDEARRFFRQALTIEPRCVDALAGIGTANVMEYGNFCFTPEQPDLLAEAEDCLDRALDLEPNHALGRYGRAFLHTLQRRPEAAREEALAAIALDRTLTPAYIRVAQAETHLDRPEETFRWTALALRISPKEPRAGSALYAEAHAQTLLGNDEEVVRLSRRAIAAGFKAHFPYTYLTAGLANMGHVDEARAVVAELEAMHPGITVSRLYANRRSDHPGYLAKWQRHLDGLRNAGVPEN